MINVKQLLAAAAVAVLSATACSAPDTLVEENIANAKVQLGALLTASEQGDTLRIPSTYKDGQVRFVPIDDWVSGFFAGSLWYMYELTGDEMWAEHARAHTEKLDSIQYLTRLVANRKKTEGEYSRITLNVGSYREKRRATLSNLAKKNAEKVRKYGRNFTFEPMNPYERRIIHTTVQGIEGVKSHSVGSDEDRRVVISLEDGVKPLNPSRGGNGGRGGRSGSRPRGGNKGGRGPQPSAPTRAPKTDAGAAGVSLYGKIN